MSHNNQKAEPAPAFPNSPDLYKGRPDDDWEKQWFVERGYDFSLGIWRVLPPDDGGDLE